jgi:ribosomal-protein-alanine N-acetyltransferase
VALSFALTHAGVKLRIAKMRDSKALEKLILGNRDWLRPWEATNPGAPNSFDVKSQLRGLIRQLDDESGIPFVIEVDGVIKGQLNVANIMYGSVSSAVLGNPVCAPMSPAVHILGIAGWLHPSASWHVLCNLQGHVY